MSTATDTATPATSVAPVAPPVAAAAPAPAFRRTHVLTEATQRKLRSRHEEFVRALAVRLATYLRLDVGVELAALRTVTFQKFIEQMGTPTHLTLLKIAPLPGTATLEISPQLGLAIADRLLGGAGLPTEELRPLTEIESALFDQVTDIVLSEWTQQWRDLEPLQHTLLGHEIDGRFLNTTPREALLLAVGLEFTLGETKCECRLGFPYSSLEGLLRRLDATQEVPAEAAATAPAWAARFDDVPTPVTVSLNGLTMTARALTELTVGATIPVEPHHLQSVQVSVAGTPFFLGALGKAGPRWAVKLSQKLEDCQP